MTQFMVETAVDWLAPFFGTFGYLIIALAIFAERSILIGVVVPADVTLAVGGIFAARGDLEIVAVILIGIAAGIGGESTGYALGRRYGRRLVRSLPLINRLEDRIDQMEDYFEDNGGRAVAFGRFATAGGTFVPFVAGMTKMEFRRFLLFDAIAVTVWAVGVGLAGFLLGNNLEAVDQVLSTLGWIGVGILVLLVVSFVVWKKRRSDQSS